MYQKLSIDALLVNKENYRHDELNSEGAAIQWFLHNHQNEIKALTKEIVKIKQILEPPLVFKYGENYIVYDGNRRITCLKLLRNPELAGDVKLVNFFQEQRHECPEHLFISIECRIEHDLNLIDEIVASRHLGARSGAGQMKWNRRAKENFKNRTGKNETPDTGTLLEKMLVNRFSDLAKSNIEISILSRLFSSDALRRKVGFYIKDGVVNFTHDKNKVHESLYYIVGDIINKRLSFVSVQINEKKWEYLNGLATKGKLPSDDDLLPVVQSIEVNAENTNSRISEKKSKRLAEQSIQNEFSFISNDKLIDFANFHVPNNMGLNKHRLMITEISKLSTRDFPIANALLVRVLLEISIDSYIGNNDVKTCKADDGLKKKFTTVIDHIKEFDSHPRFDEDYYATLKRLSAGEYYSLLTIQKFVHSKYLVPDTETLKTLWSHLDKLIVKLLADNR